MGTEKMRVLTGAPKLFYIEETQEWRLGRERVECEKVWRRVFWAVGTAGAKALRLNCI